MVIITRTLDAQKLEVAYVVVSLAAAAFWSYNLINYGMGGSFRNLDEIYLFFHWLKLTGSPGYFFFPYTIAFIITISYIFNGIEMLFSFEKPYGPTMYILHIAAILIILNVIFSLLGIIIEVTPSYKREISNIKEAAIMFYPVYGIIFSLKKLIMTIKKKAA